MARPRPIRLKIFAVDPIDGRTFGVRTLRETATRLRRPPGPETIGRPVRGGVVVPCHSYNRRTRNRSPRGKCSTLVRPRPPGVVTRRVSDRRFARKWCFFKVNFGRRFENVLKFRGGADEQLGRNAFSVISFGSRVINILPTHSIDISSSVFF